MLRIPRRFAIAIAWLWALSLSFSPSPLVARSIDEPTGDSAVVAASLPPEKQTPLARPGRRATPKGEASSGWWIGPVGITAALAAVGGISLASKRFGFNLGPVREAGTLRVVGQTRLSPKQSVYLLRVGDRVLILGAGSQGAPSTLGEVTDPIELARLIPPRAVRPNGLGSVSVAGVSRTTRTGAGFDQRIGDDE